MIRCFWALLLSCQLIYGNEVMWTATGTVTGANSAFGVSSGKKVELLVRYAPADKVSVTDIPQQSQFVKRKIYHANIKLRIELKIDGKQWVAYLPSIDFSTTPGLNAFDVFSVDSNITSSGAADLIRFYMHNLNNAQFPAFNYNQQTATKGILLEIADDVARYEMLAMGAFPGTNVATSKITRINGEVFAAQTTNKFTFSIDPKTVQVSIYVPPPPPITIHRAPNNSYFIKFTSEAAVWYELQASTDLVQWVPAMSIFGSGQEQTQSLPPAFFPSYFYRLRRLQNGPGS
jgi:hypothetical protein